MQSAKVKIGFAYGFVNATSHLSFCTFQFTFCNLHWTSEKLDLFVKKLPYEDV